MKDASKTETRRGRYPVFFGATLTALIALIRVTSAFVVLGMILGPLTAVWTANRMAWSSVDLGEGANIGFRTTFYGLLAASTIYEIISHVLGYQLWKLENLDRLFAWFAGMMRDAISPSYWIVTTIQIIVTAVCAGIFGAPVGVLGTKFFRARSP
jgi:hypothetical protein